MQVVRRDTEAQEWAPSLERGEFRSKIIFLLLQSGPSSKSLH